MGFLYLHYPPSIHTREYDGVMRLEVGELKVPIRVSEESSRESVSTGRTLVRLEATSMADDRVYHEQFQEALAEQVDRPFTLFDDAGEDRGHWRVRLKQWSHSEDLRPRYTYTMEIDELEEYEVDEIRIGELAGGVRKYEERPEDLGLRLDLVMELAPDDHVSFEALWLSGDYVPVKRVGVDDEDRSMRLGRVFWSTHDELNKYRITLVDEAYDRDDEPVLTFDLPNSTARDYVAYLRGIVDGLASLLVDKGLLSQSELDSVFDKAEKEAGKRSFDFFRVRDAEELI